MCITFELIWWCPWNLGGAHFSSNTFEATSIFRGELVISIIRLCEPHPVSILWHCQDHQCEPPLRLVAIKITKKSHPTFPLRYKFELISTAPYFIQDRVGPLVEKLQEHDPISLFKPSQHQPLTPKSENRWRRALWNKLGHMKKWRVS